MVQVKQHKRNLSIKKMFRDTTRAGQKEYEEEQRQKTHSAPNQKQRVTEDVAGLLDDFQNSVKDGNEEDLIIFIMNEYPNASNKAKLKAVDEFKRHLKWKSEQ
jgi:hypothetical protein